MGFLCGREQRFPGQGEARGARALTSCGSLWRAVAACGTLWQISDPFKMVQSRLYPAACSTVGCSLQDGGAAVCRMALEGCSCKLARSSSGRGWRNYIYIYIYIYIHLYGTMCIYMCMCECVYIYVAFGEHPAAGGLYMFFRSLWTFARPCGVSLALWVAFCLHCGALGFHFDTHGV